MPDTRPKKITLTKKDINAAVLSIAVYRGNLFAWRFIVLALFASYIFLIANKIYMGIPFYMMVLILFLPLPFEALAGSSVKVQLKDKDNILTYMKKKYKFSYKKSGGYKLTSLISVLLLLAWHIRYLRTPAGSDLLNRLPLSLMVAWFGVNLLTLSAHLIYFHFFPLKATL